LPYLHQGIGDEDDVHPVEDGRDDGVPESDFAFEVLQRHHSKTVTSGGSFMYETRPGVNALVFKIFSPKFGDFE
jgi:hypothetical protein